MKNNGGQTMKKERRKLDSYSVLAGFGFGMLFTFVLVVIIL